MVQSISWYAQFSFYSTHKNTLHPLVEIANDQKIRQIFNTVDDAEYSVTWRMHTKLVGASCVTSRETAPARCSQGSALTKSCVRDPLAACFVIFSKKWFPVKTVMQTFDQRDYDLTGVTAPSLLSLPCKTHAQHWLYSASPYVFDHLMIKGHLF